MPALSFIKCVKPCGSYFGCSKCETQEEYVHNESGRGGRVTLPEINAILRTDESLRSREQQTHHTGLSILENLPIYIPIGPMHLVYLGAMGKLLHFWCNQRRSRKVRILKQIISEIWGILEAIAKLIPNEFSRKTRSLEEVSRLKAIECRLKLLYVLPVILKHRLPEKVYNHFMLLHIAIAIFSCDEKVKEEHNIEYANNLLIRFVQQSPTIYGEKFVSYNIDNLIHLADECRRIGPIETFSCFSFENHLGKLKNLVRSNALPLEQLVNRVTELGCNTLVISETNITKAGCTKLISEHFSGPLIFWFDWATISKSIISGSKI